MDRKGARGIILVLCIAAYMLAARKLSSKAKNAASRFRKSPYTAASFISPPPMPCCLSFEIIIDIHESTYKKPPIAIIPFKASCIFPFTIDIRIPAATPPINILQLITLLFISFIVAAIVNIIRLNALTISILIAVL